MPTPLKDRASRVLAVDDEALALELVRRHLEKQGHNVVTTACVMRAEEELLRQGTGAFDCVVTDFNMPEKTGLDLLAWIKERDPSLSVIMVTARGERDTVTRTLRGGALDFLSKPTVPDELRRAVERGIQTTQQQRRLKSTAAQVKALGDVQQLLVGLHSTRQLAAFNLHFHPQHQAGGDFACSRMLPDGRQLILVGDVSGHDLKAAYVSAYFQGLLHGMIESGQEVEAIFTYFNQWLLGEAGGSGGSSLPGGVLASLSVCAVLIDEAAKTITTINRGLPVPLLVKPDGEAVLLGRLGGWPLGWFPGPSAAVATWPLEAGRLHLWTDGLEDHAAQLGVSPVSVATRLELARRTDDGTGFLEAASDDVLLLAVDLEPGAGPGVAGPFVPVVCEVYAGDQLPAIDALQESWRRSLEFVFPELDEELLPDALLCAREAVTNALLHGCRRRADLECCFQIHYHAESGTLRMHICDPGEGHHFDHQAHVEKAAAELLDGHRGLALIHRMATRIVTRRDGARLVLDFHCPLRPAP